MYCTLVELSTSCQIRFQIGFGSAKTCNAAKISGSRHDPAGLRDVCRPWSCSIYCARTTRRLGHCMASLIRHVTSSVTSASPKVVTRVARTHESAFSEPSTGLLFLCGSVESSRGEIALSRDSASSTENPLGYCDILQSVSGWL